MKKRNYKLSKEQVENIISVAKETNSFPNPYKGGTSYATIVNVLFYLGANQFHTKENIEAKFVQFFGNEITLKENWQDKLLTNIKTLMRKDYGKKLKQVNYGILSVKNKFGIFEI